MADRDDEALAELADELADVLRELRDELRASRRQREPPSDGLRIDLPSPPSPGELLTFTDKQLIPAAIAILEANIRALELLQGTIRLARPGRAGESASAVRAGAESMSRSTLERLDDVLVDLQEAATEGGLPTDTEARDVVTEARRLRDEIDAALSERTGESDPENPPDPDANDDQHDDESDGDRRDRDPFEFDDLPEVDVDIEGELESIKAELGKVENADTDGTADDDADELTDDDADEEASTDVNESATSDADESEQADSAGEPSDDVGSNENRDE